MRSGVSVARFRPLVRSGPVDADTTAGPPDPRPLVRAQVETLWGTDARGRLGHPAHHAVLAVPGGGAQLWAGGHIPDGLAARLAAVPLPDGAEPGEEPPDAVLRCRELLERELGAVELSCVPSHLVPAGVRAAGAAAPGGEAGQVVRYDDPGAGRLPLVRPEVWEPDEWRALLAGELGPWALAHHGGRVLALCFTPVASPYGAEAGVWTHPDARRRGWASAVTAAWASAFPDDRPLFYSTTRDNRSSRHVAARLGLPLLARLWKLSRPGRSGEHRERPWQA